jgi:hypothetical protein
LTWSISDADASMDFMELQINKWMNDWMNEWMNEWMNDWMNEWLNDWVNELITNSESEYMYWDFSGSIFISLKYILCGSLYLIPIIILTTLFCSLKIMLLW